MIPRSVRPIASNRKQRVGEYGLYGPAHRIWSTSRDFNRLRVTSEIRRQIPVSEL